MFKSHIVDSRHNGLSREGNGLALEGAVVSARAKGKVGQASAERGATYKEYISYRLEWVAKLVRGEANTIYRRECGLDIRQLRVLRIVVERRGLTVTEIVEKAMFERTFVSRLISQLVKKGLMRRRICDDDARQFRIESTAKGEAAASFADGLGDKLNEDLLSSLNAMERKVLEVSLRKLMRWRPAETHGRSPREQRSRD